MHHAALKNTLKGISDYFDEEIHTISYIENHYSNLQIKETWELGKYMYNTFYEFLILLLRCYSIVRHLLNHEDLEKRGGLLGGCGVMTRERHESHVSHEGDCFLWETPSQISPLSKISGSFRERTGPRSRFRKTLA